jgi:hypothetical protein
MLLFSLHFSRCFDLQPGQIRFGSNFWDKHLYVPRQAAGYYGRKIKGKRGTTQGGTISGTLSNILIDAIIRHWYHLISLDEGTAVSQTGTKLKFYVNNGKLSGHCPHTEGFK